MHCRSEKQLIIIKNIIIIIINCHNFCWKLDSAFSGFFWVDQGPWLGGGGKTSDPINAMGFKKKKHSHETGWMKISKICNPLCQIFYVKGIHTFLKPWFFNLSAVRISATLRKQFDPTSSNILTFFLNCLLHNFRLFWKKDWQRVDSDVSIIQSGNSKKNIILQMQIYMMDSEGKP